MTTTVRPARELAQFTRDSFSTVTLLGNEHVRVLLVALEPGQEVPVHAPKVDLVVTVADGVGELLVGDHAHPLRIGDVAVVPAGETRGIRARTARLVLVSVVTPPPTGVDHAPTGADWPQETGIAPVPALLIRAAHADVRAHLDHLRVFAETLGDTDEEALRERLGRVVSFLRHTVLPHTATEEETIYPAADSLMRSLGGATATMIVEHELIEARAAELDTLVVRDRYDEATRAELRRALIALETLLQDHFDKEERVYLPLLTHLTPAEAESLSAALEGAKWPS